MAMNPSSNIPTFLRMLECCCGLKKSLTPGVICEDAFYCSRRNTPRPCRGVAYSAKLFVYSRELEKDKFRKFPVGCDSYGFFVPFNWEEVAAAPIEQFYGIVQWIVPD